VLSVVVLGIILHATFDYAALGDVGAMVPGPLQMQAAMVGPLENGVLGADTQALRLAVGPLVLGAVLLIVIAVFLRIALGQSDRRTIAPAVAVIVAALVLAGAWGMRQGPVPAETEAVE